MTDLPGHGSKVSTKRRRSDRGIFETRITAAAGRLIKLSSDGRCVSAIQLPALSIFLVVSTFSSQPISISGTDFSSRSV